MTGERKLARHDFYHPVLQQAARLTRPTVQGNGIEASFRFSLLSRATKPNPAAIFRDPALMAKFINRRRFTIEWGHCDPAGIVSNSRFFEFFDWGTWMLFEAALGVKPPDLAAAFGIAGMPLVDAGARFLAPARFGDEVELSSRVREFRRSSFDVEHRLLIGTTVAVEGHETRVWAARDPADPSKMKSQPIPAEVTARFHA